MERRGSVRSEPSFLSVRALSSDAGCNAALHLLGKPLPGSYEASGGVELARAKCSPWRN